MSVVVITAVALGFINIITSRLVNKTWVSACSVFWPAWLLTLGCASYAELQGTIPNISQASLSLIHNAHIGAFFGFLLATIVSGPIKEISSNQHIYWIQVLVIANKFSKYFLCVILAIGLLHLTESIFRVGLANSASLMTGLRLSFLTDGYSFLGRLASYVFTSLFVVATLFGVSDAYLGVRMKRLIFLTTVAATHGIAMGGRGFLLGIFLTYAVSFLLFSGVSPRKKHYLDFVKKSLIYISIALIIFVILGIMRWGAIGDSVSPLLIMANMITSWVGLSIPAVGPFVNVVVTMPLQMGGNLLEWPVFQLERLGVLEGDIRRHSWDIVMTVREQYGAVGNAPPTIIPSLVGDFGVAFMPIYMAGVMALSHIVTIKLRGFGVLGHSGAVMALLAAFGTIQSPWFFTAGNCWALAWLFVFLFFTNMCMIIRSQKADLNVY